MTESESKACVGGFFIGLVIMAIVFAIGLQLGHNSECLALYKTIDGKHYYWGADPEGDSTKNYFWKSVKVKPNTIFVSVDREECTWE